MLSMCSSRAPRARRSAERHSWTPVVVGERLDVAERNAVCAAARTTHPDAQQFGDRLLCRPARRQRIDPPGAQRNLSGRIDPLHESVAPALDCAFDPCYLHNIDTGVDCHCLPISEMPVTSER